MATDISHSVDIPKDVDTVFQRITSDDYLKHKMEALGARNINITEHSISGSGGTLAYDREMPMAAPSALKKFVPDWQHVTNKDIWTGSAGGEHHAELDIHLGGAPVKMHSTVHLKPNGDSTTMTVAISVSCGIPLVGKKLEAFVAETAEKEVQADLEFSKANV